MEHIGKHPILETITAAIKKDFAVALTNPPVMLPPEVPSGEMSRQQGPFIEELKPPTDPVEHMLFNHAHFVDPEGVLGRTYLAVVAHQGRAPLVEVVETTGFTEEEILQNGIFQQDKEYFIFPVSQKNTKPVKKEAPPIQEKKSEPKEFYFPSYFNSPAAYD